MKSIDTPTDTITKLSKKVENQAMDLQKRQGKIGDEAWSAGSAKTQGGNKGSYWKNCKRVTWHLPDNCFELEKNKDKRPSYWKSILWRGGTHKDYSCNEKSTKNAVYQNALQNLNMSPVALLSNTSPPALPEIPPKSVIARK